MAACRACLTPRPRVPPARPDSSAACLAALPFCGGLGVSPRLASRSRKKGQSARSDFPAFSSFISPAISPAVKSFHIGGYYDLAALNPQSSAPPGEDDGEVL
jgi:hypothetical protein